MSNRQAWLQEIQNRRHNAEDHHHNLHWRQPLKGCPYCYPPGPDGAYRGTTWADLGVRSYVG